MTTTATGIVIPGDDPTLVPASPLQDIWNDLGLSINGHAYAYVATTTERAAYVAALTADGFTIDSTHPVLVCRGDASAYARWEYSFNGSTWIPILTSFAQGTASETTSGTGSFDVNHGLGRTPVHVELTIYRPGCGSDDIARLAAPLIWTKDSTKFTVQVYRRDTNAAFTSNQVGVSWVAW